MTDSRLPDSWLDSPRFEEFEPETWKLFIDCLMYCNRHGTDGQVKTLALLKLSIGLNHELILDQMERASILVREPWGVQLAWEELGQSWAADVEAQRKANRERQRRFRERQTDLSKPPVTRDITNYVGQDRQGQEETF